MTDNIDELESKAQLQYPNNGLPVEDKAFLEGFSPKQRKTAVRKVGIRPFPLLKFSCEHPQSPRHNLADVYVARPTRVLEIDQCNAGASLLSCWRNSLCKRCPCSVVDTVGRPACAALGREENRDQEFSHQWTLHVQLGVIRHFLESRH